MEDRLESPGLRIKTDELLAFQRDLKEEKQLLQKVLTSIDDQVHALQVEQLHLLGLMNQALKGKERKTAPNTTVNENQQQSTNKMLDLSVTSALRYLEEEDDDEDI